MRHMAGYVIKPIVSRILLSAGGLVVLVCIGIFGFTIRSVPGPSSSPGTAAGGQPRAAMNASTRDAIHTTATIDSVPRATGGRNVAHPATVFVPIASLGSAPDNTNPPPQEARVLGIASMLTEVGNEKDAAGNVAGAAEPIRSVAPVSSARDEQGQAVDVPLAVVPGAGGSRQGKTPPRPRASDSVSEKGKPSQ